MLSATLVVLRDIVTQALGDLSKAGIQELFAYCNRIVIVYGYNVCFLFGYWEVLKSICNVHIVSHMFLSYLLSS